MLIALGGISATGEITVAQTLARKLAAVYLRIDTLGQAPIASGSDGVDIRPAGYLAGYAVAENKVHLGSPVVVDSINSLNVTLSARKRVTLEAGTRIFEMELINGAPSEGAKGRYPRPQVVDMGEYA